MWEDVISNDIISKISLAKESEWFKEPVQWESLGLQDYPIIIKKPIDLNTVRLKINNKEYQNMKECIQDIRLIWTNAMVYNAINSKVYSCAKFCSDLFESLYTNMSITAKDQLPTNQEVSSFLECCFKLPPDDLSKLILLLDKYAPSCFVRINDSQEIQINIDLFTPEAFSEGHKFLHSLNTYNSKSIAKKPKL